MIHGLGRGLGGDPGLVFEIKFLQEANLDKSALYKHVNDIATGIDSTSPEKARYVAAAKSFRMPYWDWARKDVPIFPQEALNNTNSSSGPTSSASVHAKYNPLFQAPFQSGTPANITVRLPFRYCLPFGLLAGPLPFVALKGVPCP